MFGAFNVTSHSSTLSCFPNIPSSLSLSLSILFSLFYSLLFQLSFLTADKHKHCHSLIKSFATTLLALQVHVNVNVSNASCLLMLSLMSCFANLTCKATQIDQDICFATECGCESDVMYLI
jgi:hypothetical protein